jgi:hypothetical protein
MSYRDWSIVDIVKITCLVWLSYKCCMCEREFCHCWAVFRLNWVITVFDISRVTKVSHTQDICNLVIQNLKTYISNLAISIILWLLQNIGSVSISFILTINIGCSVWDVTKRNEKNFAEKNHFITHVLPPPPSMMGETHIIILPAHMR